MQCIRRKRPDVLIRIEQRMRCIEGKAKAKKEKLLMTETTNATQLLSARELAGVLGLCADSVRRAAKAGAIPHLRAGGVLRFNAEHVAQITRDGFHVPRKTN